MIEKIVNKIKSNDIKIGIIGVGYVGLPMAIAMSNENTVIAYDNNAQKIDCLCHGKSYIDDVKDHEVFDKIKSGKLFPTSNEDALYGLDCFIICVPTPLDNSKQPDMQYIISASEMVSKHMCKGAVVIIESTTYPGTTEELVKPILEKSKLICDKDFYLAFSPERVDPGNKLFNTCNTPKIVGGISESSTILASLIYENNLNCSIHKVSSAKVAEMCKILENTYRNINIGLIDEFAIICHYMSIDIWEVIDAAKTKPFGFQAFYPGPGVGGHCIPLDPYYLAWKVKEFNITASMVEASGRIIDSMHRYVVDRAIDILNENRKALSCSRVLVVGLSYKANISDWRESPSIKIIKLLREKKAQVEVYDPFVPKIQISEITLISENLEHILSTNYDLIIITTGHDCINYKALIEKNEPILDTRNVLRGCNQENIIKL